MAYITQANRPNPVALLGALALPAAFGAVLIAGLAVTGVLPDDDEVLTGWNVSKVPPPEPLPEPEVEKATTSTATTAKPTPAPRDPTFTRPNTPIDLGVGSTVPFGELPGLDDEIVGPSGPVDFGPPQPVPGAGLDPVAAIPRGDPGRWITDSDYRSSWINRGYSGTARFTLAIDAQGKVSDCTITGSTGHAALDEATCRLLERRATFAPAKNGSGDAVAGTFSSAVNWQIP